MKILIANYRYFISGGPERYMFNVSDALARKGHDVIPFSIRYDQNVETPYDKYFVSPLAGSDEVRVHEHQWTPGSVAKTLSRSFYSREVEQAVQRLATDTSPDAAYVLHFLKKLSPSLLVGLHRAGVPIVVRLSDFLLMCPAASFYRDGKPCTLCAGGSLWPSIQHRCVRKSSVASIIHYLSWKYHRHRKYFDLIDRFVAPSEFTIDMMVKAGWPRGKFVHLPTFTTEPFFKAPSGDGTQDPYILYAGRIEPHKGTELLIRAYDKVRAHMGASAPRMVIAGDTRGSFAAHCMELTSNLLLDDHVSFQNFVPAEDMPALYARALITVLPMLWYENMPNALVESYAAGTAVVGANHGTIAPLVTEGETGLLFSPGDVSDLADKLKQACRDASWCSQAGQAARTYAQEHFSESSHLDRILDVFDDIVSNS